MWEQTNILRHCVPGQKAKLRGSPKCILVGTAIDICLNNVSPVPASGAGRLIRVTLRQRRRDSTRSIGLADTCSDFGSPLLPF
ncbi:hypothetical protein EVAR_31342_1 [Eumeta japonica]|uniref:Uncharacterized protein n=1 Tax=Eumeta variegata TaxID=151549 RepID=A0A4C1Y0N1_EUMVA|nr:hypothetical protein EVAR_31342_1 [Eumeta japonica]